MYLGMMKKGASIMTVFALIFALSSFLNLGIFMVLLPVLWFYSFFDTHNLKAMTPEQRMSQEDKFLFSFEGVAKSEWPNLLKKRHVVIGGICIFLGIYLLFRNFTEPYLYYLRESAPWLYQVLNNLPTLAVAVAVIILGIYFISGGKKSSVAQDSDYIEYGGPKHE